MRLVKYFAEKSTAELWSLCQEFFMEYIILLKEHILLHISN